ncbi:response regulator transcription factor [Sanyastnella coralliicola]|uniref:response regulator transcription factor n=1 Tax=Sanyastnella coralliicola TaxID=3069118 RepID=UPI0027BAE8F8|nr:response regulator transcription factor [Longitalea sp. SCSIO 12813]
MPEEVSYRILITEDEQPLREGLKLNLELEGYEVIEASTGKEALDVFRNQKLDLAIMDVMIPDIDGFNVCKTVRIEGNNTPILFLTAKGSSADRVEGLKIGGDDYLSKPFNLEELMLRVQKLIVRREPGASPISEMEEYTFGANKVNFKTYVITDKNGAQQNLTQREIKLLKLLISKKDEVVSREEILETVWGYDVYPSTRTIDNFISAFRKYFEPNPRQPIYFFSVRGVGYKFSPR